jgi:hypothetical protein
MARHAPELLAGMDRNTHIAVQSDWSSLLNAAKIVRSSQKIKASLLVQN